MIESRKALVSVLGLLGAGLLAPAGAQAQPTDAVNILLPGNFETRSEPAPAPVDPALANPAPRRQPAYRNPRYRRLATPEFETFENEVEFRRLLRSIEGLNRNGRSRRLGAVNGGETVVALLQDAQPECTVPEDCPDETTGAPEVITVTGSRVASPAMSTPVAVTAVNGANITNTQVAAVDEGDIVKLIGEYLLVLQDGRVFAVHYPSMRLTDRVDVYRKDADGDPIGADWYDEMLVEGDQIIIAAYSYEDDATELTVLRLDQASATVAVRGVFLISSDDYYDVDNYATRIVGDKLVIYTPYEAEDMVSRRKRPAVRRWSSAEEFEDEQAKGTPLLDIRRVYRPVFGVREPWIHTVSVCPLGEVIARGLECETTGFVGADMAEMFVAGDAVYLWMPGVGSEELPWDSCPLGTPAPTFGEVPPAAVFRIPIGRGETEVMGARGAPIDQFGMDAKGGRFRALPTFTRNGCYDDDDTPTAFALLDAPLGRFRDYYVAARESEFARLPALDGGGIENRFVGGFVVYGGRDYYSRRPPRNEEARNRALANGLTVVPIDAPHAAQRVALGHSLIRFEKIGDSVVIANGYAGEEGLRVSYVALAAGEGGSAVRSSAFLPRRYESEGRSHAFNATYTTAGDGMLGVPTVTRVEQSNGYWWYSYVSDLSFLGFDSKGLLADAGQITATPEDAVKTADRYDCEVSCIDWYGNARPIFLGGKVYGLMATELVEAEVVAGKVSERRRVDLTGAVTR
jgi:hypothetical protein